MDISKDQKQSENIKVCLNCGSTNISIPPAGMDIRMMQPDYCRDCGNRGIFPTIPKKELEEFRKKIK